MLSLAIYSFQKNLGSIQCGEAFTIPIDTLNIQDND